MTKKDRLYFSVPILYKKKRLILLGICNKNNLRIEKNHTCIDCCEQIYDEIRKVLAKSGGEAVWQKPNYPKKGQDLFPLLEKQPIHSTGAN